MPWVKMDDGYPEHPKVDRVGPLAAWLNVCAWAYCARNLTDGFLPNERIARLASVPRPKALAKLLVEANLWEVCEGGYMVHDYLVYNPSREQVLAERAAVARRVADHRARSNGVTPPPSNGVTAPVTNPVSTGVGNGVSTVPPVPVPGPSPIRSFGTKGLTPPASQGPPQRKPRPILVDDAFKQKLEDEFWEACGSRAAVQDSIAAAMSHKARLKYTDHQAYLRNWLRNDADHRRAPPISPGDTLPPPEFRLVDHEWVRVG